MDRSVHDSRPARSTTPEGRGANHGPRLPMDRTTTSWAIGPTSATADIPIDGPISMPKRSRDSCCARLPPPLDVRLLVRNPSRARPKGAWYPVAILVPNSAIRYTSDIMPSGRSFTGYHPRCSIGYGMPYPCQAQNVTRMMSRTSTVPFNRWTQQPNRFGAVVLIVDRRPGDLTRRRNIEAFTLNAAKPLPSRLMKRRRRCWISDCRGIIPPPLELDLGHNPRHHGRRFMPLHPYCGRQSLGNHSHGLYRNTFGIIAKCSGAPSAQIRTLDGLNNLRRNTL